MKATRENIINFYKENNRLPILDGVNIKEVKEEINIESKPEEPKCTKEELKIIHLNMLNNIYEQLNIYELQSLCFVVDDGSRSGRWVAHTSNYLSK